jgi:hypothetical protein
VVQVAEEECGGRVNGSKTDLRIRPVEDADLGGKVSLRKFLIFIRYFTRNIGGPFEGAFGEGSASLCLVR